MRGRFAVDISDGVELATRISGRSSTSSLHRVRARGHRAVLLGLIGSILGWAARKGRPVTVPTTQRAKSRTHGRKTRSAGTKATTRVGQVRKPHTDLERQLETYKRELAQAREQQTATSEVLRVISSSPGELEPVFETTCPWRDSLRIAVSCS